MGGDVVLKDTQANRGNGAVLKNSHVSLPMPSCKDSEVYCPAAGYFQLEIVQTEYSPRVYGSKWRTSFRTIKEALDFVQGNQPQTKPQVTKIFG